MDRLTELLNQLYTLSQANQAEDALHTVEHYLDNYLAPYGLTVYSDPNLGGHVVLLQTVFQERET